MLPEVITNSNMHGQCVNNVNNNNFLTLVKFSFNQISDWSDLWAQENMPVGKLG